MRATYLWVMGFGSIQIMVQSVQSRFFQDTRSVYINQSGREAYFDRVARFDSADELRKVRNSFW